MSDGGSAIKPESIQNFEPSNRLFEQPFGIHAVEDETFANVASVDKINVESDWLEKSKTGDAKSLLVAETVVPPTEPIVLPNGFKHIVEEINNDGK